MAQQDKASVVMLASHREALVHVPVALLPAQLPAVPQKAVEDGLSSLALPPVWEMYRDQLAPGFNLI